jgi:hypothetical protein
MYEKAIPAVSASAREAVSDVMEFETVGTTKCENRLTK